MRETLLLRADPDAAGHWYWLQLDAAGRPAGDVQAGTLAEAAMAAGQLRVLVLVAGTDCLLTRVQIPGRNRQKLIRAVPYALEEQLSDEVENLHFAIGELQPDGSWPVAIIGRATMDRLETEFSAAGLDVAQLVPEMLLLPWSEAQTTVLVEGPLALVRDGSSSGYSLEAENLPVYLELLQRDREETVPLQVLLAADQPKPLLDSYPGEVNIEIWSGNALHVFARGAGDRPFNLLQGDYSRHGKWNQLWKPLRATAALLLVGLLTGLLSMSVNYVRLGSESEQLQAEIETTFRKAAPEMRRVVNPRVQMQQLLDKLEGGSGGSDDFLVLLARTASVLRNRPGVEVGGASYRGGRLDVDLKIDSLQALDQLKQTLVADGGLNVEIQSANTGQDQRVQSRLRIEGAGT